MSTSTEAPLVTESPAFDAQQGWRLHPRVALRPEPFGAMAYHYDNRRLNFLRSFDLVDLVKQLEHHDSAKAAFDASDIKASSWPNYERALASLARSDFLQRTVTPSSQPAPA